MTQRHCRCNHGVDEHETVRDDYSRDGFYTGKCLATGCECKRFNFDYERWVIADERKKIAREL